jgi:hypothetical protein
MKPLASLFVDDMWTHLVRLSRPVISQSPAAGLTEPPPILLLLHTQQLEVPLRGAPRPLSVYVRTPFFVLFLRLKGRAVTLRAAAAARLLPKTKKSNLLWNLMKTLP